MSNRHVFGAALLAYAACYIGPILEVLGAIAALGMFSTAFVGLVGLAGAVAAVAEAIVVARNRRSTCAPAAAHRNSPVVLVESPHPGSVGF